MDPKLNHSLKIHDPEIYNLVELEKKRQWSGLELIASENFTSKAVLEALASPFTNKYSEGLPGARYYGGNEYVDQLERLCQKRALNAFNLDEKEWDVNVQPYSGSTANFAVFTALLKPHERLMGLDLPSGGHLTHGYQTAKKKISSSAIFFESMSYKTNPDTGYIDYDTLEQQMSFFRPKLLICGASAYPRDWNYNRLRYLATKYDAYLMMDMAHISGLVATDEQNNPFKYCDVVTTTTHKTLRGPRAGLIFYRKSFEHQINFSVFPSTQGGPHNNTIAAVAVALKDVMSPEFKEYTIQVRKNAQTLADRLIYHGYKLVTGGTDNHCILWDLRPLGLTGSKLEKLCDVVNITLNKNSVPGDTSALSPGGVRLGTPALTSRGFKQDDFTKVADLLHQAVLFAMEIQLTSGKRLDDFEKKRLDDFEKNLSNYDEQLTHLRNQVEILATSFDIPGFSIK